MISIKTYKQIKITLCFCSFRQQCVCAPHLVCGPVHVGVHSSVCAFVQVCVRVYACMHLDILWLYLAKVGFEPDVFRRKGSPPQNPRASGGGHCSDRHTQSPQTCCLSQNLRAPVEGQAERSIWSVQLKEDWNLLAFPLHLVAQFQLYSLLKSHVATWSQLLRPVVLIKTGYTFK